MTVPETTDLRDKGKLCVDDLGPFWDPRRGPATPRVVHVTHEQYSGLLDTIQDQTPLSPNPSGFLSTVCRYNGLKLQIDHSSCGCGGS